MFAPANYRVMGEVFASGYGVVAVAYDVTKAEARKIVAERETSAAARGVKARYWIERY